MEKGTLRLFQAGNGHVRVRPSAARPENPREKASCVISFPRAIPVRDTAQGSVSMRLEGE